MNLLLNADDFGESASTNAAILQAGASGVIRSVSVLGARESVHPVELPKGYVWGAHLYLTEYRPWVLPLVGDPVQGKAALFGRILSGAWDEEALVEEFMAQVHYLQSKGFPLAFLDTHQNVHGLPVVASAMRKVAARLGLKGATRPIHQLHFSLRPTLRTVLSGAVSSAFGLEAGSRVLVGCPGYQARKIDLALALSQWRRFLAEAGTRGFREVIVPCHPGLSPAETELYGSPAFRDLLLSNAMLPTMKAVP